MKATKPYKKVGKPVDSTWMKEMGACFDPPINLNHLPDHLCLRDSKDIIQSRINCAETALVVSQDVLEKPPPAWVGHSNICNNRSSRFYEAPPSDDDDASEDHYSMPAFTANYVKKTTTNRTMRMLLKHL